MKVAKYDATNLENAIRSDDGLGVHFADMKLRDLKHDAANSDNPFLRVCVTTITYDSKTGGFTPRILDSND